jgi:hypothetical protein
MVIIFRACESGPYVACRPAQLPKCNESWGLNEIGPLGQHGMASYNKIRYGRMQEEIALLHERNVFAGRRRQELRRQNRSERPVPSGPMHVNVFLKDGIIKRFFITPMTKNDGHHIDITIPRVIGLEYGLFSSRTVNVQFRLTPSYDHPHPYAIQASSGSFPRRLGILISGSYAHGSQMGESFEYWIQCNRPEAVVKAEKLARRIRAPSGGCASPMMPCGSEQATRLDNWLQSNPMGNTDVATIESPGPDCSSLDNRSPAGPSSDIGESSTTYDPDAFNLCICILQHLKEKVQKKRIRAMDSVKRCLDAVPTVHLAKRVAEAIRPGVLSLLRTAGDLDKSRKVSLLAKLYTTNSY